MSAPLPEKLDPWRAVQSGAAFAGEASLAALPRLGEVVLGATGPAHYALRFERDAEGRSVALGYVSMPLRLTCQRCLGEVEIVVGARVGLELRRSESAADPLGIAKVMDVPAHLEPQPVGESPVRALDWIEDELLLAIPSVPMHPAGHCDACHAPPRGGEASGDRPNPFAILADLRRQSPPGEPETPGH